MLANLENSAVNTALEKVSVHSNLKEGQYQRTFKLLCSFQTQGLNPHLPHLLTHLLTGVIINIITSLSSFPLVTIMLLAKINVKSALRQAEP